MAGSCPVNHRDLGQPEPLTVYPRARRATNQSPCHLSTSRLTTAKRSLPGSPQAAAPRQRQEGSRKPAIDDASSVRLRCRRCEERAETLKLSRLSFAKAALYYLHTYCNMLRYFHCFCLSFFNPVWPLILFFLSRFSNGRFGAS